MTPTDLATLRHRTQQLAARGHADYAAEVLRLLDWCERECEPEAEPAAAVAVPEKRVGRISESIHG